MAIPYKPDLTDPLAARFWALVDIHGAEECWPWTGSAARYGSFTDRTGHTVNAHRMAWRLAVGDIPAGLFVCHHCDNPKCCNPNHLFLGTPQDNQTDSVNKGRRPQGLDWVPWEARPRGEDHYEGKLNEESVLDIRFRLAAGESQSALARDYGVRQSLIGRIWFGTAWAHVGGPRGTPQQHKLTAEQRAEIKRRALAGENREALAQEFGVKVRTVYKCCE